MTILTKAEVLAVISRIYGPEQAESLAARLPDPIDLDDVAVTRLLYELGLTREGLVEALGAEL
jgi:hypothetical protein